MKKAIFVFCAFVIFSLVISSCVVTQPWERENFAKPIMIFDKDPLMKGILQHHIDYREGSAGGTGSQSGGCGCG